jgi:Flp pilus assembly protein TadB
MELPPAGGVLASALGGIGVFLVTRAVLDRPFRSRRVARLRRITPVERPLIGEERQEAPLFRTPLLEELVGQPLRRAGEVLAGALRMVGGPEELAGKLERAGTGMSPPAYYGQRLLWFLVGCIIAAMVGALGLMPLPFWSWLLVGVALSFGPAYDLEARLRRRQATLVQQVRAMVDMLQTTVSAGSGPEQALELAARALPDPLGRELREVMRRARLGEVTPGGGLAHVARQEGLLELGLVADLWQTAETTGMPLGERLRELGVQMREMRRIAQREEASRATVRVLFPIAFFILVPLMVVLLFPACNELILKGTLQTATGGGP